MMYIYLDKWNFWVENMRYLTVFTIGLPVFLESEKLEMGPHMLRIWPSQVKFTVQVNGI